MIDDYFSSSHFKVRNLLHDSVCLPFRICTMTDASFSATATRYPQPLGGEHIFNLTWLISKLGLQNVFDRLEPSRTGHSPK